MDSNSFGFWIFLAFVAICIYGCAKLALKVLRMTCQGLEETRHDFTQFGNELANKYNNLSEIDKSRSDKRTAQMAKYGGSVGVIGFIWVLAAINPLLLVPMGVAARFGWRNWIENTEAIKESRQ